MPVYVYRCATCSKKFERFLPLAEYDKPTFCACGSEVPATKQLQAPMIRGDYADYTCPVTGKLISGRRAHEENLKRHGCRVLESGEREDMLRRKAREEQVFDSSLDSTIEETIYHMTPEQKTRLANEVEAGVTATVVRG